MTTYRGDDGDCVENCSCMRPLHGCFFHVILSIPSGLLYGPENFQSEDFELLMKSWVEGRSVEVSWFGLAVFSSVNFSTKTKRTSGRNSSSRILMVFVWKGLRGSRPVAIAGNAASKSFNITIRFWCLKQTPYKEHFAVVSETVHRVRCLENLANQSGLHFDYSVFFLLLEGSLQGSEQEPPHDSVSHDHGRQSDVGEKKGGCLATAVGQILSPPASPFDCDELVPGESMLLFGAAPFEHGFVVRVAHGDFLGVSKRLRADSAIQPVIVRFRDLQSSTFAFD